ncbi:MAG: fibronectin type III domain-containing protein, partial [Flavobacteriales bacterium]|nr:fibronectin type III domain-containing protein [Flavobacteriales bacterium]
ALHGWDRFGHPAPAIDTLFAASLDPTQMPMPTDLSAQGDSTGHAVRVRWRLPDAALVKQLTLFRSTNSETDFTPIAVVAGDRTEFVDDQVRPATSYFYYFVLEYKATHVAMRAPMFAASVQDPTPPDAPEELAIDHDGATVRLQWTWPHADAHSFLVLRNEGDGAMQPVSGPLPALAGPHRYTWVDSTRLQPGRTYGYTVRATSTSHVHGPPSDTMRIVPDLPPPVPPAPRDLALQVDGSTLLLSWDDLSGEPFFLGYELVRTRTGGGKGPQADTLIVHVNHFTDTVYQAHTGHRYQVRTLNQLGGRSAFSAAVHGTGRFAAVPPPSQVHARRTGPGVEVTWAPALADHIVGYEVQRHVRGSEPVMVGTVGGRPLRLQDATAPHGPCFYRVRSVAADGRASAWSGEAGAW